MTTPTPAPPPRDRTVTVKVNADEYTEFHFVAARERTTLSEMIRRLVRERAEEIRAARREAERFRRGEWGGKDAEREQPKQETP